MKKRIVASLSLLFLSCLCACNSKANRISIFYYDKDDTFLTELNNKIVDGLDENYTYKNFYAEKSQLKQNLMVADELDDSNVVLLNMVDRLSAGALVEKCKQNEVPVVFFNREPLLEDMITYDDCYYVGPNPEEQGKLQIECVTDIFGNPGSLNSKYDLNHDNKIQLVILKGEQGHQDAERRTQSCLSNLRQKGYDIELLSIGVCNWSRQEAYSLLRQQYYSALGNVELIIANNDEMAIGAASYIRSVTPPEGDIIPIIGVDATPAGIDAVNSKLLFSTIVNDADLQAKAICELVDIFMDSNKDIKDFSFNIINQKFVYIESAIYESKKEE